MTKYDYLNIGIWQIFHTNECPLVQSRKNATDVLICKGEIETQM